MDRLIRASEDIPAVGGTLERKCVSCGSLSKSEARFCNVCGMSLASEGTPESSKNQVEISPEDTQEIIEEVRQLYSSIPILMRPLVPPIPQILERIPASARKYTLQQLIDLLEEAHTQGLL